MTLHTTTKCMFTFIYFRGVCIGSSCLYLVLYIFTGPGTAVLRFIWALYSILQLHHTIPLLTPFRKEGYCVPFPDTGNEAGEYHGEVTLDKTKKRKGRKQIHFLKNYNNKTPRYSSRLPATLWKKRLKD